MTAVKVRMIEAHEVIARVAEFEAVYLSAYQPPPYEETAEDAATFARELPAQCRRDGFKMVIAETPDGILAGFVYGYSFAPDRWWRSAAVEPELTRGHPKFAIIEFVVVPASQGAGIGRTMMAMLLADRPEPFAVLCSNPRSVAREIYRRWGWREVGTTNPPHLGLMDVLLLDLPHGRSTT